MTAETPLNVEDLLGLARDKSVEGRTRLVQIVSDLFFDTSNVISERERLLMTDILRQLIHDVEMSIRKLLAQRLATEPFAPRELVLALANDTSEVAHPILVESVVLQDIELIEIIRHRSLEHQLAIAIRRNVSEQVSDALVETGNDQVITTLLNNKTARISISTMESLVVRSEKVVALQKPLLDRDDLSPELVKRMYWWVSAALRQHIVATYDIDPVELEERIEQTVVDLIADGSGRAPESAGAQKKAPSRQITPRFLVDTLRQGEVTLFEDLFAEMTGLRKNLVRRFIFEPGGEGLAVACKATEIDKADFASIFLLTRSARPGDKTVDPDELPKVMHFFDRVKPEFAKKVLKRLRLDPNFLFALKQTEDIAGAIRVHDDPKLASN